MIQAADYSGISFLVLMNLIHPEFNIGFRNNVVFAALVSVPKVTVDKYHGAVFRQHDIWRSR